METKFQGRYRIGSLRAKWWDYNGSGAYFITICTKDRNHFFGEIQQGKMILSEIGKIARQCWEEIPEHFPFVKLGAFVVMPDHIHGVVFIEKEAQNLVPPHVVPPKFGPQSKNLASIIRGYKVGVTKSSRQINPNFSWQSLYHDKIILNWEALENISKYIEDNPKNWGRKRK